MQRAEAREPLVRPGTGHQGAQARVVYIYAHVAGFREFGTCETS